MSIIDRAKSWMRAGEYDGREIHLAGKIDFQAADGEGAGKLPTFTLQAYNGGPMLVDGWDFPVVVDLTGAEFFKPQTPVIADHEPRNRIGHTTEQAIDVKGIRAKGVVSATGTAAQEFIADARNKFPFEISIGAKIILAAFVREGESVQVNGRTLEGPLVHAKRTSIRELSALTLGADGTTSVSIAAKDKKMAIDATNNDTDVNADDHLDLQAIEKKRIDKIKLLCLRAAESSDRGASDTYVMDPKTDKPIKLSTFKSKAIREGWEAADVKVELLRAQLPGNAAHELNSPAIHVKAPLHRDGELAAKAATCSVLRSHFGMPGTFTRSGRTFGLEKMFDEQTLEAADRRDLRQVSLHQLMAMTIEAAGSPYTGNRKTNDFLDAYYDASRQLRASGGGFSTLTTSTILEDAANKALLLRFQMAQPVWQQIAKMEPLDDFKPKRLYRLDENLGYKRLDPQGQITHGELTDSKRTIEADTYARMIALDRRHVRNDDLSAFTQIISGLADGAIWALESAVAAVVLENSGNFFHADNNNLIGSPLGIAGLTAAEVAYASHVGAGGKPIVTDAALLVVPTTLDVTARNLLAATPLLSVDANAAAVSTNNPFAGKYRIIQWRYLNVTGIKTPEGASIPGQSDTKWLLLSDPMMGSVVTVGLLDGQAMPTIQSSETDFNTLGMQWRGFHDFGVSQGDEEYGVLSTGDEVESE